MSLLTSLITEPSVANQPFLPIIEPKGITGGAAVTANTVYLYRLPRQASTRSVTALDVPLATNVAGNVAGAYYTCDATSILTTTDLSNATFTRVAASSPAAIGATNTWQRLTMATAYSWPYGADLWAAIGFDVAANPYRSTGSAVVTFRYGMAVSLASAYSSGLPATITGAVGQALIPLVVVVFG